MATDIINPITTVLAAIFGAGITVYFSMSHFYKQKWWESRFSAYEELILCLVDLEKRLISYFGSFNVPECPEKQNGIAWAENAFFSCLDELTFLLGHKIELYASKNSFDNINLYFKSIFLEMENLHKANNQTEIQDSLHKISEMVKIFKPELVKIRNKDLKINQSTIWQRIQSICEEDNQKFK